MLQQFNPPSRKETLAILPKTKNPSMGDKTPVILSKAKNLSFGGKTRRFAQGDKRKFPNRLLQMKPPPIQSGCYTPKQTQPSPMTVQEKT